MRRLLQDTHAFVISSQLILAGMFVTVITIECHTEIAAIISKSSLSANEPTITARTPAIEFDDECDCKIIEYIDVCGKDDPCTGADE